jgi:hypothetical protein
LSIAAANRECLRRMLEGTAHFTDVRPAREALPRLGARMLLHAGPPIGGDRVCGPLRGAVIGACLFEGWADTAEDAAALAASGALAFAPCHHHEAVRPMAGVIGPSMAVFVVENRQFGTRAHATLNEGLGRVLRMGAYDPSVIERLHWLNCELAPLLAEAIHRSGPLDLKSLIAQALTMGDEVHNRSKAATALLARELAPRIASRRGDVARALTFLADTDHFFLNLSMAAVKATLDAAHGIPGSTLVTALARNGTDFGIRVSGTGPAWFTAPAPRVKGLYFPGYGPEDANPDLGDSAITETAGLGAFALASAPTIVQFVGGTARLAVETTELMYEITVGEHSAFKIPALDFRGTPVGIDIRKVVETGITPAIDTGIAHREPGVGQIGAGLSWAPLECFTEALDALAHAQGVP